MLGTFSDLLVGRSDVHPATQQRSARERFPLLLRGSHLLPWGSVVIEFAPRRTLIGVAPGYSRPDLELLDLLNTELGRGSDAFGLVEVFDVQECSDQSDFERYVPGIAPVFHTPVVGIWENKRLVAKASGKAGRDLILDRLRKRSSGD